MSNISQKQLIPLKNTRIDIAGVMRCCLATVAEEYADPDHPGVSIGMTSRCRHCNQTFTLVDIKPFPMWSPDWVIAIGDANEKKPSL